MERWICEYIFYFSIRSIIELIFLQYNGKGVYVCPTGTYDGEYVTDQKEGTGTLTYANGKVYKGQWKKNMYHGTGTLTYPSGIIECYTGEWQANRRHGNGILRFFNGDLYEGHFKDNRVCKNNDNFRFRKEIYLFILSISFMEAVLIHLEMV